MISIYKNPSLCWVCSFIESPDSALKGQYSLRWFFTKPSKKKEFRIYLVSAKCSERKLKAHFMRCSLKNKTCNTNYHFVEIVDVQSHQPLLETPDGVTNYAKCNEFSAYINKISTIQNKIQDRS